MSVPWTVAHGHSYSSPSGNADQTQVLSLAPLRSAKHIIKPYQGGTLPKDFLPTGRRGAVFNRMHRISTTSWGLTKKSYQP